MLVDGERSGRTGIAVSACTVHAEAARDFDYFVAGGAIQRGLHTQSGGQPAHADAWTDDAVNCDVHHLYRATRATLEGAWVRPGHNGYMMFQHSAATTINAALTNKLSAGAAVDRLNELFELSFRM
jgi:multiple sugar transport system substrate-binding protein